MLADWMFPFIETVPPIEPAEAVGAAGAFGVIGAGELETGLAARCCLAQQTFQDEKQLVQATSSHGPGYFELE